LHPTYKAQLDLGPSPLLPWPAFSFVPPLLTAPFYVHTSFISVSSPHQPPYLLNLLFFFLSFESLFSGSGIAPSFALRKSFFSMKPSCLLPQFPPPGLQPFPYPTVRGPPPLRLRAGSLIRFFARFFPSVPPPTVRSFLPRLSTIVAFTVLLFVTFSLL